MKINKIVGKMKLKEIIALMLAFGQQRFFTGPMMSLTELMTECNLEQLFSYLVLARGNMAELTALG